MTKTQIKAIALNVSRQLSAVSKDIYISAAVPPHPNRVLAIYACSSQKHARQRAMGNHIGDYSAR